MDLSRDRVRLSTQGQTLNPNYLVETTILMNKESQLL